MNSMNAPKILPWVAKRAGISEELALKLWRRAVGEAGCLCGKTEGSEFWGLAVELFQSLVEDEAGAARSRDGLDSAPHLSWIWHQQNRVSMLGLMAAQNAYECWNNTYQYWWRKSWQQFCLPKKAA